MFNKRQINFATLFGLGFLTKFPGTLASFFTLIIAYIIIVKTNFLFYIIVLGFLIIVGYFSTSKYITYKIKDDPSEVVIDEAIGQLISSFFLPYFIFKNKFIFETFDILIYLIMSFIFFRFFDIIKPWPISFFDKKKGAFWVLFDDILAGIISLLISYIILGVIIF
tara:strand:- start:82 stop:579 length:498 start_codon:yes stop_codon:yes gene_type:complete